LTPKATAKITAIQEGFALRGQRVLLLAKKIIPAAELDKSVFDDINGLEERLIALNIDLTIVGLVALVDPPRDDTAETVRVCRNAGIRFAMVTGKSAIVALFSIDIKITSVLGDFALTATAIAEQVGIITTPLNAVKHLSDLPYDKPLAEIPAFDSNKEKGDLLTSLVLSGQEMTTMTESQWKQVMTVR
jgi:sodium/potassium-transporting ATPase subunit alpha